MGAAAGPGVPIVAMTYYDPFLGLWGRVPGGRALARANQRTWAVLNAGLATAYGNAGVTVADVAATFRIDDFTDTVFFGDPHANRTGYRKIARTFDRELQGLLP